MKNTDPLDWDTRIGLKSVYNELGGIITLFLYNDFDMQKKKLRVFLELKDYETWVLILQNPQIMKFPCRPLIYVIICLERRGYTGTGGGEGVVRGGGGTRGMEYESCGDKGGVDGERHLVGFVPEGRPCGPDDCEH